MNIKTIILLIVILLPAIATNASLKVYLIHGYAGPGFEMKNIQMVVEKEGYTTEIYTYPSLVKDVEVVGKEVFEKIQNENYYTIFILFAEREIFVMRVPYQICGIR